MKRTRKFFGLCACLIMCSMILAACGGGQNSNTVNPEVDLKALGEKVVAVDTTLPEMKVVSSEEENAALKFGALSDYDYDKVEGFYYAFAADGTAPEIAIVQLKDSQDASEMMSSIKKHMESRKGTMAEYAPEQVELLEKAVVTHKANLVLYAVCEKNGLVQKEFSDAF